MVPDLAGKLPGRGVWLTAERDLVDKAEAKRLFSRGFKTQAAVPEGLADLLEKLSAERLIQIMAMARKAGQAVTGFEKVKARLAGSDALLVQASDAGADGREKMDRVAGTRPRITALTGQELGLAFGRAFAIHAALDAGGLADRALAETDRLAGLRPCAGTNAAEISAFAGNFDDDGPKRPRQDSV